MITIKAKTINDAFYQLCWAFMEKDETGNFVNTYEIGIDSGSFGKDKGGDQTRIQADLVSVEIECPGVRPLAVTFPEGCGIPPVCTEDSINEYFTNYIINPDIPAKEEYTYGSRMFAWPYFKKSRVEVIYLHEDDVIQEFNQVQWVIDHLKEFPQNNHCCIQVAKGDDFMLKSAPCLRSVSWKLLPDNTLNITVFFRSWDLWSALPTNLGGLQLLNEYVAQEIGATQGKMFAVSDGLHIYSQYLEMVHMRLNREYKKNAL